VECRYVRSAEADGVAAAEPHQDAQTLSEAQEERPPGTSPGAFQRQLVSDESSPVRGLGFFRFFASPAPQFREGPEGDVKDYGYGSMEGLIHLKLCPDEPSHASTRMHSVDDVQGPPQSVQQVEQQLDHDVSRFEMTLPSGNGLSRRTQLMEVRLAEQESHIAYLEDENLTLKERLFLAQQEANELRQRLRRGGSCISVVDEHDDACSDYGSSD
jgi:hypothetical protein